MLEGLAPKTKVGPCKVRRVIEDLEESDALILKSALADKAWRDLGLTEALNERGIDISNFAIRRHRRLECSCRKIDA